MGLCLSPEELEEITGKERSAAQARALRAMGIEHRVRPDGTALVLRAHVEHLLNPGGKARVKNREPNWSALAETPTP